MAERRMLSKSLLMDNKFLTLSNDSKSLYLYLLMFADDDGIVKRSIMIDSVLNATDNNYSELEEKGLIIAISGNDEIRVITNWNGIETIREKLYSPTIYLNVRSRLYLKTDFSYTLNKNDPSVFSSADKWINDGRPKNIKDFKPLIQQHLKEVQYMDGTSTVQVQDMDCTSTSPDQNRSDQYRLDQSRTDQDSKDQISQEKINSANMQLSSSNGGMGENASSVDSSTSSKDNNATSENAENGDRLDPERTQEIASLFDSLNQAFDVNLSVDDERLRMLFDNLLNQYKIGYIENGLIELSESAGNQNKGNVKSLVVNHLSETVKSLLTN
ncbi:hypothetical protein [Limosilactobacillus vaginalis]|uniref:hypothetical protein n=1 Tax=Limosilactobacillus vaginalis TaxID=1633 RepID=UPI0025A4B31B|nr:hypothetical protein [Limosilactobacillus vaginalis]MDM8303703.1 hypothetical protein [Limosilactobacillus vaginalis]